MDPDVVVHTVNRPSSSTNYYECYNLFCANANKGLPLSFGLAVFMVASSSLELWGPNTSEFGLWFAAILAGFRGEFFIRNRTL